MSKDEALKLALDLAIMHHSDEGYAELRSKVRQLAKEALAPTSTQCEVQDEKGLFIDLIAQHEGLAEKMAQDELCSSQEPIREVLKQVLELTESMVLHCDAELNQHDVNVIVAKGIEALAQPDYRAVKTYHEGKPVYVSQPEQEPSITKTGCGILTLHVGFDDLPDGTKFYTTPPKRPWVGLTDEEISQLWISTSPYFNEDDFAKAVEAKLKEKNT